MNTQAKKSWMGRALLLAGTFILGMGAMHVVTAAQAAHGGATHHGIFARPMRDHGAMIDKHVERMLNVVDASDDQRSRIKALMQQAHGEQKQNLQQLHEALLQIKTALAAREIDSEKIGQLRAQEEAAQLALTRKALDTLQSIAAELTPEQREILGQRFDQMFAAHFKH